MTREALLQQAKPILFNTESVRGILDDRKTATRRAVKYKYINTEMRLKTDKYGTRLIEIQKDVEGETYGTLEDGKTWHKILGYIEKKPPYRPGDILYVRETWQYAYKLDDFDREIEGSGRYYYAAGPDDALPYFTYWLDNTTGEYKDRMPWRPSIHMPKEAARILLRVTDVRVERLQDSFNAPTTPVLAIRAEGIDIGDTCRECIDNYGWPCCIDAIDDGSTLGECGMLDEIRSEFSDLWTSTIKPADRDIYGWKANPWVWVIEFERLEVD